MKEFTNLYNVQKTLCFELEPVGVLPEKVQELQKILEAVNNN